MTPPPTKKPSTLTLAELVGHDDVLTDVLVDKVRFQSIHRYIPHALTRTLGIFLDHHQKEWTAFSWCAVCQGGADCRYFAKAGDI